MSRPARRDKIIVFAGTTPNIGATLIAFGTAVRLAAETKHNIGFICLNLKSSKLHRYLGIDQPGMTLDNLRADIRSQGMTPERLLTYCQSFKHKPNLHVLYGNRLREQAEYFSMEDIEFMLRIAEETFDLCIVEVNAYWDNAATIGCMLQAGRTMLVTTQEMTHFQEDVARWSRTIAPIFGLNPAGFGLVVTQIHKSISTGGIRPSDIAKETGMKVMAEVRWHPDVLETLNHGRIMDLYGKDHPFYSDLTELIRFMMSAYHLRSETSVERQARRKLWIQRLWSGGQT